MADDALARPERWARFRFSVIGGLLASPPEGGALQQALRDLATRPYQHPFTRERIRLGFSTLERWYYQAKETADPLAALGRKVRADTGRTWALAPELLALLAAQYQRYPRWTVQLHYDNLAAEVTKQPALGTLPSYQTVRRRMQEQGWVRRKGPTHPTAGQQRATARLDAREVRSFEAGTAHGLWHLDFHQARVKVLDAAGRWHTPMVLAILDDYSRLCCHLQGYLTETTECLVHGLTQALLKRGLPRALLTDNGAAMLAAETQEGLARLGIVHETTLPYAAYQNGKQEVFWAHPAGGTPGRAAPGRHPLAARLLQPSRAGLGGARLPSPGPPGAGRGHAARPALLWPRGEPAGARCRRAPPGVQPPVPPDPAPE